MSHVDSSALSTYNSLSDGHLSGYFANTRMRRHLRKAGLVSKRGEIVSEATYRINMARKEHKKHVKDLLAQAIVHKTLDLERHRQVEIRKKLEEIAKIELVRRVKTHRGKKGDEEVLPYLSPRSRRPQSGPAPKAHQQSQPIYRPISAPPNARPESKMSYGSYDDEEEVIYCDDEGNPIDFHEGENGGGRRSKTPREEVDARQLYILDPAAIRKYAMNLARMEHTQPYTSPYMMPQVPIPPRSPRVRSRSSHHRRVRSEGRDGSPRRPMTAAVPARLHRQEPAMKHQGQLKSMCEMKMKYHGWALNLAREKIDPRQEIVIEQQHCGGNTLTVFKDKLLPGSTFTFTSYRHRGYPFSLTIYVDGRQDSRVSTCCEYRHHKGVRLGGKQGHFSIVVVKGAAPCSKCQVEKGVWGSKAPPPKLKQPSQNADTPNEATEEIIVVKEQPRDSNDKKEPETRGETVGDDYDNVNYEDDFEDEEDESSSSKSSEKSVKEDK